MTQIQEEPIYKAIIVIMEKIGENTEEKMQNINNYLIKCEMKEQKKMLLSIFREVMDDDEKIQKQIAHFTGIEFNEVIQIFS